VLGTGAENGAVLQSLVRTELLSCFMIEQLPDELIRKNIFDLLGDKNHA
jgi:hypothetical protein